MPCASREMLRAVPSSSLAANLKASAFSWSYSKPCKTCLDKQRFVSTWVACWLFAASAAGVAAKEQVGLFFFFIFVARYEAPSGKGGAAL